MPNKIVQPPHRRRIRRPRHSAVSEPVSPTARFHQIPRRGFGDPLVRGRALRRGSGLNKFPCLPDRSKSAKGTKRRMAGTSLEKVEAARGAEQEQGKTPNTPIATRSSCHPSLLATRSVPVVLGAAIPMSGQINPSLTTPRTSPTLGPLHLRHTRTAHLSESPSGSRQKTEIFELSTQ